MPLLLQHVGVPTCAVQFHALGKRQATRYIYMNATAVDTNTTACIISHDDNAHIIHNHRSTLYTVVTKYTSADQVGPPLEDGCYVSGLYLEGAGWDHDKQALRRQDPKVNTAAVTAVLLFTPCVRTRLHKLSRSLLQCTTN
jgi:Dynein heavy chain C-terminal domain